MIAFKTSYREGAQIPFQHVHKGRCDTIARQKAGGHLAWQSLDKHLAELVHTLGLNYEKLQKALMDGDTSNSLN